MSLISDNYKLLVEKYSHLVARQKLRKGLDDIIEEMQVKFKPLEVALEDIYEFLKSSLDITGFYIKIHDESLKEKVFSFGACSYYSDDITDDYVSEKKENIIKFDNSTVFVAPMDIVGNMIGKIGISYDIKNTPKYEFGFSFLDCVSDLLDNYCFNVYAISVKSSIYNKVQTALKRPDFSEAIDQTVKVIYPFIGFDKLLLVFSDKEITGRENLYYFYFEGGERIYDSLGFHSSELDSLVHSSKYFLSASYEQIRGFFKEKEVLISYLRNGTSASEFIGFVAHAGRSCETMSVLSKELFELFLEELQRRLVELNYERNGLRKYFSNEIISRLIVEENYIDKYLMPRNAEIGILFADISGFTKICEQILVKQEKIVDFVNVWAEGLMKRVFPLGGCLDKLVGDCAIFLFGPPFYSSNKEETAKHLLQSAKQIVKYTKRFLEKPVNRDIYLHEDFNKFGVAVGLNICPVISGLIGPNDDLTAFGSGMNNTARLQGVATANQILLSDSVYEAAKGLEGWSFSEERYAMVKNVKEPLKYYQLLL